MNTLRNRVQLIGHTGKDPEIKNFDGGKKIATGMTKVRRSQIRNGILQ